MPKINEMLLNEISRLPLEKIGKVISFVRFLEQEPEYELVLNPDEDDELYDLLDSNDVVDSSELLAKIMELPDD
jgi:hypothetical protein